MGGAGYDVIVVGARCAGSPLATLLARAGLRVCVLDRATFPSDVPSTHGIQPTGVRVLQELGVAGALARVSTPIDRGTVRFDDSEFEVTNVTRTLGAPMLNVRRVTLDAVLVEAAAAAGAEVRTSCSVTELIVERDRVAGVKTTQGELRAPLVIGADGVRSTVARLTSAREYHGTNSGRIFTWAYFAGADADRDRVWIGRIGEHGFLASPTDDGLFMAAAVLEPELRADVRRDRDTAVAQVLRAWPQLHATIEHAEQVGPARMMTRLNGYFRVSAGPGWALLGDAGHFKDPTPGQGIADALRQAVALAEAVVPAFERGPGAVDRALTEWWAWRDRDAWEMYWLAHQMAAPGPTPALVCALQRRIAERPQLAIKLLRVLNHELPPSKLFTPGLAVSTLGRSLRTLRGQRRQLVREAIALAADDLRHLRGPASSAMAARA